MRDALLIKRIKEGDVKAFEQLFRFYYTPLMMYAYSITGRREVSEEIIQELFFKLWRDREELRIFQSLKSYLYTSVRNQSLRYHEYNMVREQHKEKVIAFSEKSQNSTPQEQLEYKELEIIINQTLERMPERRRQIFAMHRYQGLKYKEIAEKLSISVKTVEAEMTKTYKALRVEIEKL
ncbi:RNA polymerase sigma-70 factor [Bacteroides sp. 214]|uniref:RNA polymerase sigma-70 factor n=1 Tax=Bacteroides sp. 214 TaxID=2302935 RepID=UPI0013CF7FB9|nr:RNA polymerase sigma-70 factor [Bacteroides sp. 214]NDW11612.1 RNA polymerase sigma-70 factor [Bacteroides sp. 214]